MVFDLEEPKGVWFDLEDGGRVQFRLPNAAFFKGIQKETVQIDKEYKRLDGKAERFEVERVDREKQARLFWDYVIESWEGLFDVKNNPIPCTTENKILLIERSVRFAKFCNDCVEKLRSDEDEKGQVLEKN